MAEYNGHRSRNAWNVALWIGNDEGLYNLALRCLKRAKDYKRVKRTPERVTTVAAHLMLSDLPATTPDGAKYNVTCVREALRDLQED
jgi:hypothetical protein